MDPVPLVSVVLPTYNRMAYLPQAIDSVLRQTETRWELLLADDGSTDGTSAYLDGLGDPRIRLLRLPHSGLPETVRNVAMAQARGRYIAFLDSDDQWESVKLAVQLAALDRSSEYRWSYTRLRCVDQAGHELPIYTRRAFVPYEGMILDRVVCGQVMVVTSTVMVERGLINETGGFDTSLSTGGDLDLWMRLAERGPAVGVPEALTTRLRHAGNHGTQSRNHPESVEEVFRRLVARAPTARLRRLGLKRRARWLAGVADQQRIEGRYGAAWRSLLAAVPHGLAAPGWWSSALKTLARPLLSDTVLAFYRGARRRLMARGERRA